MCRVNQPVWQGLVWVALLLCILPILLAFHPSETNRLVNSIEDVITEGSPTVTTDKQKYNPEETAYITATGFQPGEIVEFQVLHIGNTPSTGNGHDPWQVTDGDDGDSIDGEIHTTWYVDPDDSFNSTFELTATGLTSGFVATHTFTDDTPIPTAMTSSYDAATDVLTVNIDWTWKDPPNARKAVSVAVFADINGDGNTPGLGDDPTTWMAAGLPVPSDEFLGQIASSNIEGFTMNGDSTDSGISSKLLAATGQNINTPIVLMPYGLAPQISQGVSGSFTVKYSNVPIAPAHICVVLYDIHVNKKDCDGTFLGTKYDVEEGVIDVDGDGNYGESPDDNATNFEGTGYNIIAGEVDVNTDGSINGSDDITDYSFFGFTIIDGGVDITNKDGIDDEDDGCFSTIGGIDHADDKHSPISATASGGTPAFLAHNEDNSVEDGFGGTSVACDDPINSVPPTVVCPAENTGTIAISKN